VVSFRRGCSEEMLDMLVIDIKNFHLCSFTKILTEPDSIQSTRNIFNAMNGVSPYRYFVKAILFKVQNRTSPQIVEVEAE